MTKIITIYRYSGLKSAKVRNIIQSHIINKRIYLFN